METSYSGVSTRALLSLVKSLEDFIRMGDQFSAQEVARLLAGHHADIDMSLRETAKGGVKGKATRSMKMYLEDEEGQFIIMDVKPHGAAKKLKEKLRYDTLLDTVTDGPEFQQQRPDVICHMALLGQSSQTSRAQPYSPAEKNISPSANDEEYDSADLYSVADENGWECPLCTFYNKVDRPGCEMCGRSQPEVLVSPVGLGSSKQEPPMSSYDIAKQSGWTCSACTYRNIPTKPGCEVCSESRPDEYLVPEDCPIPNQERARLQREQEIDEAVDQEQRRMREEAYQHLLDTDETHLISPTEEFRCPICLEDIDPTVGVRLRDCLHDFCRNCISNYVNTIDDAVVTCPYQGDYTCRVQLQEREIRALVTQEVYQKHLERSVTMAETRAKDSFHCKTPNCRGWCFYVDGVHEFRCPICNHESCLNCGVIHEGKNCREYQDDLQRDAYNNETARQGLQTLEVMLTRREAMRCPNCNIIIQKNGGCDNMYCTVCNRGFRWQGI